MIQSACKATASPTEPRAACGRVVGRASMRSPRAESRFTANVEPSLEEIFEDEVMHRLMARDGVRRDELMSLVDQVRQRLVG